MQKRIVLVGAGSAQFGYGTIGDILQSKVLEGSQIVLHDINPDTLAVVEQTGRAFIAGAQAAVQHLCHHEPGRGLPGRRFHHQLDRGRQSL